MKNWMKNTEGRSTSSEDAPEYFGTKDTLSLKNENIMCDNQTRLERLATDKHSSLLRKFVNYGCKKFYRISPGERKWQKGLQSF